MTSSWRYVGCAVGFGFGVVWMTVGLGSAILVLLCASLGYGVAFVAEHERAGWSKLRRPNNPKRDDDYDALLHDDELDHFERRDDELPDEEIAPVAAGVDYGWPTQS